MKDQVENALFETISDIEKWEEVLELFVSATGASKGIISLRDRLSAEIFIPDDVVQELSSPLAYGFTEQEAYEYITEYVKHDPWTKFENLYHPESPYPLSSHFPLAELKQSVFWKWLEPQNISDTVVFKVGDSSPKYWVGMNLHYDAEDKKTQNKILDFLTEHKNIIRNSWKQGQKVRLSHFKSAYAEHFIEQQSHPTFLFNSEKEVLRKNQIADKLLDEPNQVLVTLVNNKLQIQNKKVNEQLIRCMEFLKKSETKGVQLKPKHFIHQDKYYEINFVGHSENIFGENTSLFQLSVFDSSEKLFIWANPILTRRESELVEVLAKGGKVVDFQNHHQIKKVTAHMHWSNVKNKLNIKDRSEIYAAHKIFLKTYN